MARFSYHAVLITGQRTQGTLRCSDRREAIERLLARGIHPLQLERLADSMSNGGNVWQIIRQRVSTSQLAVFTRQFAALLKAGLPMVKALATVRRQLAGGHLVSILEEIEQNISADGVTLAEALGQYPRVFKPVYRGLVHAGEDSGNLVETLEELAGYLSRSAKLRGQVFGAFVYPCFIVFLGFSAVFVLMTFVIPKFKELFESFGGNLPLPTKVLISASGFMAEWWWAVLMSLMILITSSIAISRTPRVKSRLHMILLRIPIMGEMILKLELCRIARTLSSLLQGGVRILEALEIAGQSARNLAVSQVFPAVIRSVSNGETVATAFERVERFPPLMISLIRTGEETGRLGEMLLELADIYEDEAERAVTAGTKLIEPVLIVIVGGIVAAILAAVMLPIFEANTMVS